MAQTAPYATSGSGKVDTESARRSLGGVNILIVEDDPLLADDLRILFERHGASVQAVATSVQAALESLDKTTPDCAVVNGGVAYETAMRVTKRLNELGVPYLIQSGHAESGLPPELKDALFFTKPIDETKLIEGVEAMIKG